MFPATPRCRLLKCDHEMEIDVRMNISAIIIVLALSLTWMLLVSTWWKVAIVCRWM